MLVKLVSSRYGMEVSQPSLHAALERVSSLFRAGLREVANRHDLKLVQLEALVYLSMANRYSDTPLGVADYLGVTKGTASQTIKALSERGLVEKVPDDEDGRILHCRLTPGARRIVRDAYPVPSLSALPRHVEESATDALRETIAALQRANGLRTFGQCRTCRMFEMKSRGGRCGLTGEALSTSDQDLLCREHEVP